METIKDIVAEMCKDIPRVLDSKIILRNYADRIKAACKLDVDNIRYKIYRTASEIRGLVSTSMARERGVSCEEVRNIAIRLETIVDEMEV